MPLRSSPSIRSLTQYLPATSFGVKLSDTSLPVALLRMRACLPRLPSCSVWKCQRRVTGPLTQMLAYTVIDGADGAAQPGTLIVVSEREMETSVTELLARTVGRPVG